MTSGGRSVSARPGRRQPSQTGPRCLPDPATGPGTRVGGSSPQRVKSEFLWARFCRANRRRPEAGRGRAGPVARRHAVGTGVRPRRRHHAAHAAQRVCSVPHRRRVVLVRRGAGVHRLSPDADGGGSWRLVDATDGRPLRAGRCPFHSRGRRTPPALTAIQPQRAGGVTRRAAAEYPCVKLTVSQPLA